MTSRGIDGFREVGRVRRGNRRLVRVPSAGLTACVRLGVVRGRRAHVWNRYRNICDDDAGVLGDASSRVGRVHAAVIRVTIACDVSSGPGPRLGTVAAVSTTPSENRRTGRPRRSGTPIDGDPRDEILAVASRLFSERGVAATTMAEIARRSGLQQSSVYHYFGNKEQVLGAIVAEANRAPLELVKRIRADGATPVVQLYRIIRADVAALCALPYDLNELHRLAARDPKTFARYWKERERLEVAFAEVIADGVDAGELQKVDARLAALTVMSNDEATQNWMRHDPRRKAQPRIGRRRALRDRDVSRRPDRARAALRAPRPRADPAECGRPRCPLRDARITRTAVISPTGVDNAAVFRWTFDRNRVLLRFGHGRNKGARDA